MQQDSPLYSTKIIAGHVGVGNLVGHHGTSY